MAGNSSRSKAALAEEIASLKARIQELESLLSPATRTSKVHSDATAPTPVESALRESEDRYRVLFDNAADAIFITDMEANLLAVNLPACIQLGYTREELITKNLNEVDAPDSHLDSLHRLTKLAEVGVVLFETTQLCKDGTRIPVEVNARAIQWQGKPAVISICRDISERKRTEDALIDSEAKYRTLFENMAQGAFYQRSDGALEDCNPSILNLFGITRDQFLNRDSMDPDWRVIREDGTEIPGEQHPSMQCMATGKPIREQMAGIFNPRLNDFVWLSINATPMFKEGHTKPYKVFVTLHDITALKKAEKMLKDREQWLRLFIENAPVAIAMFNREMRFISTSKRYVKENGFLQTDLRGLVLYDLLPELPERWREAHQRGLAGEVVRAEEDSIELADGTVIWIRWEVHPWHDSAGQVAGIIIFSENITERKLADKALRERNSFIEKILENAPIGFAVNTIHDGRTVFVGSKFEEIYGVPHGSLQTVDEYFEKVYSDPVFREQLRTRVMADMASGDPSRLRWDDVPITTASGEKRFVCAINIPLYDQNLMVSTVQDVTERHTAEEERSRLEEQLQHAQKLESVGRLAGGVAHDFNNMLGVILGHTELALEQTDPTQPLHEDLTEIQKAAQRSADLTRQLLAFARKQTVVPRALDLNQTVSGMARMLQRLIGEDIKMVWNPGHDLWLVEMDPSQIDQIMANLAVNARDAIHGIGTLTIETANTRLDESYCSAHSNCLPGDYVLLAVSDTGVGMEEEILRYIFEPFFTTKELGKGTGLGLATVYGIVKQNSGYIDVNSQPGKGTRFEIYLPRHKGEEIEISSKPVEPIQNTQNTVLLVEDEPSVLRLATLMLQQQKYNVLSAPNPKEAILLANEHPGKIDILMTDLVMPEMNGQELAKVLLARHPNLKCLFVSGWASEIISSENLSQARAHFLQKPFSIKELTEALLRIQQNN